MKDDVKDLLNDRASTADSLNGITRFKTFLGSGATKIAGLTLKVVGWFISVLILIIVVKFLMGNFSKRSKTKR